MLSNIFRCLLFLLFTASSVRADWPMLFGPNGAAKSDDTSIPITWSADENMAWSVDLPGAGTSSPIIIGNKLILTCYTGYGIDREAPGKMEDLQRHLLCYDATTGKKIWQKDLKATMPEDEFKGYIQEHGYASGTPVSDGQHIFVFFGKSGLFAFDMDGKQVWQADVGNESNNRQWGSATSPVLYKDTVILNASDECQAIIAFNKADGSEKWRTEAKLMTVVFSLPRFLKIDGRTDLVMRVSGEIWGLNPETGKLRWFAEHDFPGTTTASVLTDGKTLYTFGGFPKRAAVALTLGGKGDLTKQIAWTSQETPGTPTPILNDGRLYWHDQKGMAVCLDASTGKKVYKERLSASGIKSYASPIQIGDHIYAVTRNKGTFVYKVGDEFKEEAVNVIAGDNSDFSATPAISDGRMYLRSAKKLYCIKAN